MWLYRNLLSILLLFIFINTFAQQQDVDFHLNAHLLTGKKILKVKRDFYDPYLWVLASNNEVYRVNSLTQTIDDYTATFAGYGNLSFIDIAGRSKDTVYIATNSSNVIQYKKGSANLLTEADGIPGTVNSVGMYTGLYFSERIMPLVLMIGSDKGFRLFDPVKGKMTGGDAGDSKIYEATYRTIMYKDSSNQTEHAVTGDTIQYQPTTYIPGDGSIVREYLWEGGKSFGYHINTAINIFESIYIYKTVFTNMFWGNNNGMYQNFANYSFYSIFSPSAHYLNGIKVNKITNIYGLTSFGYGDPDQPNTKIKQNLLIGTDHGFYFSSSIYGGSSYNFIKFSLFHDDELGNVQINDVCVNASQITKPICEDGVWLAADDGLYYLKPDYGKYFNSQQLQAVSFENQDAGIDHTNICEGNSVEAVVNEYVYSGQSFQWYKNGKELPGESKSKLTIKTAGDYYAVLYDPCESIHLESNHLKVIVTNAPVFSFNYPDKLQQCDNTPVLLQTDNNPGYHYRWYTNGVLNNITTFSFTVTQTGKYKVEVSTCDGTWISSKEVEVDLMDLPVPRITSAESTYCQGDAAIMSLNTPAASDYTINWYKDGILLPADKDQTTITATASGSYTASLSSNNATCSKSATPVQLTFIPSPVFTFAYPDEMRFCDGTSVALKVAGGAGYQYRWYKDEILNGNVTSALSINYSGKYKVEVSACSGTWIASKEVQVDFTKLPVPLIALNKPTYCMGDMATLSLNIPLDPSYTVNWYKDDILLNDYRDHTSMTTTIGGNYKVKVISNQTNTDMTICSQLSDVKSVIFNDPPTVHIEKMVATGLCQGQTVVLKADHTNGLVKWSTGETSDQITVNASGHYSVIITSTSGCDAGDGIDINFFPSPILDIKDASVCVYNHQTVTLTAPAGFVQYNWNGQPGNQTVEISHPQRVSLTVTDENGCQATQLINVTDACPDVKIPNTFTPNGDGINDTWNIQGVEYDPAVLVSVFTRYGSKIFESKGYGTQWGGEYKGKKLPAGTYYYIISIKNGQQKYSGYVTIIY